MQEITIQNDFDYSIVSTETASKLKALSNQLDGVYQNYQVEVGGILYQAQQELANYDSGIFGNWLDSKGLKRNAYNYIHVYKLLQNLQNPSEREIFLNQPKSLQYEMSKPSANQELNQKVFDGDVTTHKKYKELERKLKESEERNKQLAEQTQQATKEVIKEVVKEVPVAQEDYQQAIQRSKDLSENIKAYADRNAFLEKTLNDLHAQRAEVDEKSAKYDELTEAIKQSQGQLNSYQRKIASYKNFMNLFQKADQLMMEISGLVYSNESQLVEVDGLVKSEFNDLVDRGLKLFNDLDQKRKGSEVLEGELL